MGIHSKLISSGGDGMTNRVLQCCYTNASQEVNGKISSGWKAVAVSADIPSEAYTTCVKLQSANSTIQSTMLDETGNVLNLLEIVGDGNYLYVMRSQYGLLDRLGRPNMFSHAFILPCKEIEFASDPNNYLTISSESFKDNEEAASEQNVDIRWNEGFDLEEALKKAQLSDKNYATLIQCVYTQFSNKKSAKPLFIQYDGTEENMMSILFCIYSAIPLSMRRKLSVASVVTSNTVDKNIIFSINAKEKEQYIVPNTGENNILTNRMERKISRLGFVDYTTQKHVTLDEPGYFRALEEKAIELGDSAAANELILKIAHLQLGNVDISQIDDDDLDAMLSDALRSNSIGSDAMDKYIAEMLEEVTKRKLYLTDENEESLTYRLENPTEILSVAAEKYNFYRFSMLPTREAAKKLSKMTAVVFEKYRRKLSITEKGQQILDCYYSDVVFAGVTPSWEFIEKILENSAFMQFREKTLDRIGEEAWKLYSEELKVAFSDSKEKILSIYDKYMHVMKGVLSEGLMEGCENAAKEEYWELQSFDNTSFDKITEYVKMRTETKKCTMILSYCILPTYAKNEGEIEFYKKSNSFFKRYAEDLSESERESAIRKLLTYTKNLPIRLSSRFEQWGDLFIRVSTPMLFEALQEICSVLADFDEKKLQKSFEQFVDLSKHSDVNEELNKKLAELLFLFIKRNDSYTKPISLDLWLCIAAEMYPNCFELFDEYDGLYVLDLDPDEAIEDCSWITKRKYIRAAEDYIENRGEAAKTVNKWLKEARKIQKQSARAEISERRGILDRGLSALSGITQEVVAKEQPEQEETKKTNLGSVPTKKDEPSPKTSFLKGLFGKKGF